jgi:hypothetical protein
MKKNPTKTLQHSGNSIVPPEHDERPAYIPPEGWTPPPPKPPMPTVENVSQSDYDGIVRKLFLPREEFWRKHAHNDGFRKFIKDKNEATRSMVACVLQLDLDGNWPTLDSCIPKGSILEAVDRYFWEFTDIPREIPFFYVLHYVMAKLMQEGVEIHKGQQVILPDLWTVVVAPSGAGKSMSQKALAKAMDGEVKLFPEARTSLQFLTNLRDHRLGLFVRDEFAQFLKSVSKNSSMQDVRDYLLRTYDNGNIEHTTTKSSIKVEKSAIGILGYTPVATLTKYLTAEMLLDGFAQRFSFCVAERDDRGIVGDYNFDGLAACVGPLWEKIAANPFHRVYKINDEGRSIFNLIVETIVMRARHEGIDDSFSRRLAFSTYKYGLAYHIISGNTDDTISRDDLAFGAQLTAMHMFNLRKILTMYGVSKDSITADQQVSSKSRASIMETDQQGLDVSAKFDRDKALKSVHVYLASSNPQSVL